MNPISRFLDILFPRRCHVCGSALADGERHVCRICLDALPRTHYHLREHNPMETRFAGIFPFEKASAWLIYSRGAAVTNLIHDFKYRGIPSLADELGEAMGCELAMTGFFGDADAVMPVPMYPLKQARRGYNQARLLAAGCARATALPLTDNLRAARGHKTQTRMTPEQRVENLRGVFRVENPEELSGRHIVLIDDVCTTGSTLREAAETLTKATPDCRLSILALAATI